MGDAATEIRERVATVVAGAARLRSGSLEERVSWLAKAAVLLADEAINASLDLATETGLTVPMVEWGLRTTLDTLKPASLRAVASAASADGRTPISFLSVVLAGNLFTASVRPIMVPLLLGVPVLAKVASRDRLFPTMLREALRRADPDLGSALELVSFPGGDSKLEAVFVEAATAIAVFGSDDTVSAVRRRHPERAVIEHGHGVSAAYCGREALCADQTDETIRALALDVCAYDQRGCLSPQVIYVDANTDACERFAKRLARDGLEPFETVLPRGPLPPEVGAAQAQWRGLAEVEGTLVRGNTFAIAIPDASPPRWSPGYRNVTLLPVEGPSKATDSMKPLGGTLKCVGVDALSRATVRAELERADRLTAYTCALGTMQTPTLDAPADGKPVWYGLVH
jgi:hypothetical protein